MATLPTTRTATSTEAEHLADHAELARVHNMLDSAEAAAAWTTWTPAFTNGWVIGNGTFDARYKRIGRTVHVAVNIVFGSTSTFGTAGPFLTGLPFTPSASVFSAYGFVYDASAGAYAQIMGDVTQSNSGSIYILTGTHTIPASGLTTTVPMTWAAGDQLRLNATYEAAT